ncbi:MAG: pentapeptide repeat-containing protein [Planctomycetes bacterium]|nr:pentapeptide repeat-containing protein [Planctomycetota bacterium]
MLDQRQGVGHISSSPMPGPPIFLSPAGFENMPAAWETQIQPPTDPEAFERLCRDLWAAIWRDPDAKMHGRSGQRQCGVDVFGRTYPDRAWAGVQCKRKDSLLHTTLTEIEVRDEVKQAQGFRPPLSHFTMATTGPRDATIQGLARNITADHASKALFAVQVWSWEDIRQELGFWPDILRKHFPDSPYGRFAAPEERDFLDRVIAVCRLREEQRKNRVEIARRRSVSPFGDHAEVIVVDEDSGRASVYALGAVQGDVDGQLLQRFREHVHDPLRKTDPWARTRLVFGGRCDPEDLVQGMAEHGVLLTSFVEYQGLLDFRTYLKKQTERLLGDPVYPADQYVPQKLSYALGRDERSENDALKSLRDWVVDREPRFILTLADAGTGKTFLLHKLALALADTAMVPMLIELRYLEKARSLNGLIAQHLEQAGMTRIDLDAFRYMLREGRIALLFDGFDELVQRVTYDRATEHFDTIREAAGGNAKVVVTSRTEHFVSKTQVLTALGDQAETLPGRRLVKLQPFDKPQILQFLENRLTKEEAAERYRLLDKVKDLLGLSTNPRMLSFIADVPEKDLRAAEQREGSITAAALYRLIIERWLKEDYQGPRPRGTPEGLTLQERWTAVPHLALLLWRRPERSLGAAELPEGLAGQLEKLASRGMDMATAAQQIGSRTLLVRDDEGNFSFLHRSILEWLVANAAAEDLKAARAPSGMEVAELSDLMAEFLRDLAGPESAVAWARGALSAEGRDIAKRNALLLLRRCGVEAPATPTTAPRMNLAGQDLRGRDFSGQDLRGADLAGADLTDARLRECRLEDAVLRGATLAGCDLTGAHLERAQLQGADLSRAKLLGADLRGVSLDRTTRLRAAKLVGARFEPEALALADAHGAALSVPSTVEAAFSSSSPCSAVRFSPNGMFLASGHENGTVRLWDVATGSELRVLRGHRNWVTSVAFGGDGRTLASGSDDRTVRLWEVATGKEVRVLKGHVGGVRSVAFDKDGRTLASGGADNAVRLWEIATGNELRVMRGHQNWVRSVAFGGDGRTLASGSDDKTVRLWEVATGMEVRVLRGHENWVTSVAFGGDGRTLASGSYDQTVRLWEVATGTEVRVLRGHENWVTSVAFGEDGRTLASGSNDNTVRLWKVATGKEVRVLKGHAQGVLSVAFGRDGRTLASGAEDNTVRFWEVATGKEVRVLKGHEKGVTRVAFGGDGRTLASTSNDNTVRLWKVATGKEVLILKGHERRVRSVAFAGDGRTLASGSDDKTVRLWDVATGKEVRVLKGHEHWVHSVAFAGDGRTLASGSFDQTVRLWEVATGKVVRVLKGHELGVTSVAFAGDGKTLASGSYDQTVRLWELTTGTKVQVLKGHEHGVTSVAFSRDGRTLASGSYDQTVRLWEVATGKVDRVLRGHEGAVSIVAFGGGGNTLASGSADHTVRLWEVATGQEIRVLNGHESGEWSVAFGADGRTLASASDDGTVRLWDVATGECQEILAGSPDGWAAFRPDGRYKVGGDTAGLFWHVIGLCRFEPGELDPYAPGLRLPDDAPLVETS